MSDRQTPREPARWLRRSRPLIWPAVVVLVLVLGVWGFYDQQGPMPVHEAVYRTLKLFTVDLTHPDDALPPLQLWIAAFLAPLVVVRAIAGLFPGKVSAQMVRWVLRPGVVVFGANQRTIELLDDMQALRRWRRPVVVVDPDRAALATITTPRVWKSDGASESALRHPVERAATIVVLTGDNARNSTVTSTVLALEPRNAVLFVEVEQPGLARTLEQGGQRVDVETVTFSAAGLAAGAVLDELGGVDWDAELGGDKDTPPAVALFGTGVLVDAVVLELHHRRRVQLLEDPHKARVRPRVLLFGPDATRRRDALATLMGGELDVLDLDPLDCELDQIVELSPDTARHLSRHPCLLRVMVLAPSDLDGGGIAITLARHLGPTRQVELVVESASSPSGDEIDRQSRQSATLARVRCFRAPQLAYRLSVLQAQRVGPRLARALYEVDHPAGPPWGDGAPDHDVVVTKADEARALRLTPVAPARPDAVGLPALTRTAVVSPDLPEDAPLRALGLPGPIALARAGLHVDFHRLDALVAAGRALVGSGTPADETAAFGVWAEVARLRDSPVALRDDLHPVEGRASDEIRALVLLRQTLLGSTDARRALRVPGPVVREPTDPAAPIVVLVGTADDRDATARQLGLTLARLPAQTPVWATASPRALLDDPPPNLRGPGPETRWTALTLWSAIVAGGNHPRDVRTVALPGAVAEDLMVSRALGAKVGRIVSAEDDDLRDVLLNGAAGIMSLPDDPATVRAFLRPTLWPKRHEDKRQLLARDLHGRYVERQRTRKPAGDPALRSWPQLSPWLRRSNLAVVDDIPAKLTHLGLELVSRTPGAADTSLTKVLAQHLDELAELEHGRFTAERVLSGWTSGVRNPTRFVTPYLVPWAELSDEIKDYDREVVSDLPEVLARQGLGVRPAR